jgi:hypothetical protein
MLLKLRQCCCCMPANMMYKQTAQLPTFVIMEFKEMLERKGILGLLPVIMCVCVCVLVQGLKLI